MRAKICGLLILAIVGRGAHSVNAEINLGGVLEFMAGGITSGLVHETGHQIAALSNGRVLKWNSLSWHIEGIKTSDNTTIRMAGLMANSISTELVLVAYPDRKKRRLFWTGLLVANILEGITYPTLRSHSGDFGGKVVNKDLWRALFVGYALFTVFRLMTEYDGGDGIFLIADPELAMIGFRWGGKDEEVLAVSASKG